MRIARQRQQAILAYLKEKTEATVHELAIQFEVSMLTIRRDLIILENQNIQRFHGGARFVDYSLYSQREICINAIAREAVKRIEDEDILFINSSQTALCCLSKIKEKSLTVVTNNGRVLTTPLDNHINLVLCGGNISFPKEALTGEFALSNLKKVTATRCILGISGISFDMGLSTPNITEVAVNKSMLKRTQGEKIIVADSSKLEHDSAFTSGELSAINTLITDSHANSKFVGKLRNMGIEVVLVDVDL